VHARYERRSHDGHDEHGDRADGDEWRGFPV